MKRAALIVLFFLFSGIAASEDKIYRVPIDDSPSLGAETAPVTIIEFIDFQ